MIHPDFIFNVLYINILKILFLWIGSGIGVMYFVEKHKGCSVTENVLYNFWYIFAVVNIISTIILLILKDFRIILTTTIILCFGYYFLLRKMNIEAWKRERKKKYRRQVIKYEMAKKKYF